ncbi:MAG TPA: class I SAM-dependent methyltransferase [bacterium]
MKAIDYDPFKAVLGKWVSHNVFLRKLFYAMLGALFLRQWHVRKELRRIARKKDVHDVFDAGSGYGQYSYFMSKLFPHAEIQAVDVKEEQVHDCRRFMHKLKKRNCVFMVDDLTTFKRPEQFDLALSVDVMEHILDDAAVYRNVFESLRPGGLFVIATPRTPKEESHQHLESVVGEHVREGYTKREFIEKLSTAGFQIEKMGRTYGPVWGRFAWTVLQRIPMRLLSTSKWFILIVAPWLLVFYLPAALSMFIDVTWPSPHGGGWLVVAKKNG